ncbi:tripartite motif-containing protein 3-like [Lingula anatina]|uniref:Tripartite motif-containing protein 3-like n=1 Tax=Lingula anatina TaxID=7574 RepID=A0A2R2ML16_LINAN|nr:tripartite motif-containing protein 3-like [Lingula anatina]|eukprot:XP_023930757.1 tripartite motif-containing protein 3-like [Lingula anatina]
MAESLAADIKENILTCSICLGEYKDPRVLPCYHTFCYGCISDHATRTLTPNRTFLCPICREEVQFPVGGLDQLKKNFIFSKTKDIITKQQEKQALEEDQSNVAAVTQTIAQMTIRCEKHSNNELKYYCEDDDTVVCGDCALTDHYRHGIVPVDKVAKSNRDKINASLLRILKTTNRLKEAVAKEPANEKEDSHIRIATIKNIKKQAQSMRSFIDQKEETLISEVHSHYDNMKKQKEDIITKQQEKQALEEDQSNVAAVTQTIAQMTIRCEKHSNNELKYYCEDDDTVVCGDCALTDHYRHGIVPVDKVAKSNRDKINASLLRILKTTNRLKEAVAKEPANEKEDSHIRIATIKNIKKQAQSMRSFIDQKEETLISEVNSHYDNMKKQKEANKGILEFHHAALHSACDFAQELITNGTDYDVMVHAKPLIDRLAVMEKTPVLTQDTSAQISYKPGEISTDGLEAMLGQLTIQSQTINPRSAPHPPIFLDKAECVHTFNAKLTNDRKIHTSGLAIDEDQVFVVETNRTKIFMHTGEFQYDIEVNRPWDVAVSQTGHLYITSRGDRCVKVYSTRGQQVTTMGQHLLEDPRGITLNREGHVMLYQYGGTQGSGHGHLHEPHGVCTDSYGHIFIADWGNSRKVALSPQGQFIRYIATKDDGLLFPAALAINPAGQLVVAERHGKVKTFQYLQ